MKKYSILLLPVLLCVAILIYMHVFSPQDVGPAGILLLFILMYLLFLSICSITLYFGLHFLARAGYLGKTKSVKPQKAYYIASVVARFPVFLIAIRSIGELKAIDVLLVGLFVFLASFYVARRT